MSKSQVGRNKRNHHLDMSGYAINWNNITPLVKRYVKHRCSRYRRIADKQIVQSEIDKLL